MTVKTRVIPCLDVKDGRVVKGVNFVALRDAGKPVVVSMGSVAASGGYFISCPADTIVAQPTTITVSPCGSG